MLQPVKGVVFWSRIEWHDVFAELGACVLRGGKVNFQPCSEYHFAFALGHDMPYGTGVGRIGKVLDELKQPRFEGNISIEYEYNWDHSVPEIKQCVDFVREHGQ